MRYKLGDDEPLKIGEKQLKRLLVHARIEKKCTCKQKTILIDYGSRLLKCSECGALLDPFDVVTELLFSEKRYWEQIKYLREEVETLEKWMLNNRMGQTLREIASNIRSKKVPLCPHCKEPFELEQITGWTSKEYAIYYQQEKLKNMSNLEESN